jgi:ribose-phosphate pyrophosphokinase
MTLICFSFPQDARLGGKLAASIGAEHQVLDIHEFPDGESRVRLRGACAGRSVIVVCGGRHPNTSALPAYFAAVTARSMGATSVGLVSPYLAYMRQDTQFHEGEAVSAVAYARFLASVFDWLVTVDPHLHRMKTLDAVFSVPAACVSSMPAVADWIGANVSHPVLVGPDRESTQWAETVARRIGCPWTILEKTRTGDREVTVSLSGSEVLRGRSPVIVDDIVSSGRTVIETILALRKLGAAPVTCAVVHALFAGDAESAIREAGVARLVSTNTVVHGTNEIDVVPLLVEPVRSQLRASPRRTSFPDDPS